MTFEAYMRRALYDPEHGYYRKPRDPFGKDGDFFTASQLPIFGSVVAAAAREHCTGRPFYELGPGRGELAAAVGSAYSGIGLDDPLPAKLDGFLFANEFFDALPVRVGTKQNGILYELLVENGRLARGSQLDSTGAAYVERYWPFLEEGGMFEIGEEALAWMDRISAHLQAGCALLIDYGYTTPETVRFPQGTLMSYRSHIATDAVLERPGEQDITAHVAFDALMDRAAASGFESIRLETLAAFTLRVVESEPGLVEGFADRQQLKTLLFGMGETFRCLWLKRAARAPEEKGRQ